MKVSVHIANDAEKKPKQWNCIYKLQQIRKQKAYLSEFVCHIVEKSLHYTAVAVAALKGLDHSGDSERQQEEPDDEGDLRRFLQNLYAVHPAEVDHVEVAIDGQDSEEGDAGSSVEKQHEQHDVTHGAILCAPQAMLVVVGLEGKTDH